MSNLKSILILIVILLLLTSFILGLIGCTAKKTFDVVYKVSGTASIVSVKYMDQAGQLVERKLITNNQTFSLPDYPADYPYPVVLSIENNTPMGCIEGTIIINDKVWKTEKKTGFYTSIYMEGYYK